MNKLNLYGQLLASEDQDSRELTYQLLPYGEDGFTNLGKVKASHGALDFPENLESLQLNLEHDYKKPVGKFTALTDDENGIFATVRLSETSRGNDALLEAREGLRTGISIEIDEPIIKAGQIIAGRITGAGLVVRPAFENAQLIAEDFGASEQDSKQMENETPLVEQGAPLTAAHSDKAELGQLTFDAMRNGTSLQAALADQLATDDAGKVYIKDQEVGELFENRKTERPFVNKVGVKSLTSLVLTGTRKNRTFAVTDWAGNKVELPTGKFTTSREYWNSKAKAVAVDIGMELIEFGDADVIADLYEQAVDSYVEQTEDELKAAVVAGATAVTGGATNVIDVVSKAAETLNGLGGRMDFVLLSPELYSKIVNLKTADAPYWLSGQSTVDISGQRVTASGIVIASDVDLPAGTVVIGDVRAIDYRESKEFRYKAVDLPRGGVDISLIKFNATKITDAGSILKFSGVTDAVAPAPVEPAA
ncbi:hypothetical protein ACIOTN_17285 [Glutamicibacter sp. NPDC087661]|uniref:hypothetical protein n=1 Tax=Glutamicibacter sp. NPDC087661 TaxID=3363996 RepID=UPI0037F9E276